ncbi:MAG: FHA domain-containing protein [Chloroflexi bacterium]|nr:FHA domain-containing protein [Chloroflexota bacterium]
MTCPQCGTRNPDDFMFCLQCGAQLGGGSAAQPSPDLLAATRANLDPVDGNHDAPEAEARLRVEQGSVDQREILIDRPVMIIGRRLGSDIVIHDTNVSRQHARIAKTGSVITIEDTKSSNGTLVNEERLEDPRELRHGDVVRIGDAVFVFEQAQPEPMTAEESSFEGATLAIDLDSPMTSLGAPPELSPPAALSAQASGATMQPSGPLTPPPPIMDPGQTAIADNVLDNRPDEAPSPDMPLGSRVGPHDDAESPGTIAWEPSSHESVAREPAVSEPAVRSAAANGGSTPSIDALRREIGQLGQDLVSFANSLGGLADRVERIEQGLDQATAGLVDMQQRVRGPDGASLRELRELAAEVETSGLTSQIDAATRVLEQLVQQPRDIELLLKLSQQATAIEAALRVHGRLVALAPRLRGVLGSLLD